MGALCEHYHWPPDFWKSMGWATFWAWMRERNRSAQARAQAGKASPFTWRGREQDQWWREQDEKRRRMAGR